MQFGVIEDAEERVEIFGGDGIILMVVAGGASNCQGHESASGGVNAIVLKLGAQ